MRKKVITIYLTSFSFYVHLHLKHCLIFQSLVPLSLFLSIQSNYTPLFVVSYYFLQRNLFSSMNQYLNTKFTKTLLILFKYLLLNLYAIMIKCYVSLLKMEVFI